MAKPPCPFFCLLPLLLPKASDRPPWPGPSSHRPTLDTSILLMENSAQGVEGPPAGDIVGSALWLAQGTIKPIRLPLATPKVQAVKQGVQSKTSNQSHYPSHPPLPTWGTLEMSEHTRGRSSTWSVTTAIKKLRSTCLTRKQQLRTQSAGPLFSTATAVIPCCKSCAPRLSQPPQEGSEQSLCTEHEQAPS